MIALAALLLWSAAAQEIAAPGAGGNSSYAYFVMVGPIDAARSYRPWLFSAVAMASNIVQRHLTALSWSIGTGSLHSLRLNSRTG